MGRPHAIRRSSHGRTRDDNCSSSACCCCWWMVVGCLARKKKLPLQQDVAVCDIMVWIVITGTFLLRHRTLFRYCSVVVCGPLTLHLGPQTVWSSARTVEMSLHDRASSIHSSVHSDLTGSYLMTGEPPLRARPATHHVASSSSSSSSTSRAQGVVNALIICGNPPWHLVYTITGNVVQVRPNGWFWAVAVSLLRCADGQSGARIECEHIRFYSSGLTNPDAS